ncbi:MAG: translation initiation factor IF-2 [Sphingobacteriales bacterium]|nr:MAG: translation initiation factor IF-2 [Sphingobacteriales bacterium]
MSENPKANYRLARVASEINVGIDIVIEHLKKKNIEIEKSPNAKISEEVYQLLLKDFKSDLALKEKAEHIHLRTSRPDVEPEIEEKKLVHPKEETKELVVEPIKETPLPSIIEVVPSNKEESKVETSVKKIEKTEIISSPIDEVKKDISVITKDEDITRKSGEKEEIQEIAALVEAKESLQTKDIQKSETADSEISKTENNGDFLQKDSKIIKPDIEEQVVDKSVLPEIQPEEKPKSAKEEKTKKTEKKKLEIGKKQDDVQVSDSLSEKGKSKKAQNKEIDSNIEKEPINIPSESEDEDIIDIESNKIVLSGPKVVGKINLEDLNHKTRPEKKLIKSKKESKENGRPEKKAVDTKPKQTEKVANENPDFSNKEDTDSAIKRKRKRIIKKIVDGKLQKIESPTITKKEKDKSPAKDRLRPKPLLKKPGLDSEVSEKEIQEKIKATMARLGTGGISNQAKNSRAKLRKLKKETDALKREAEELEESKTLHVTEFITANELAQLMGIQVNKIITTCFNLGLVVSINQRLDAEVIELLSEEFGYKVEFAGVSEEDEVIEETEEIEENLLTRPPIVTIMGHVDHGKTSLLDYIRTANVVAGEMGGITQHIGAYEVTTEDGKHITFLDTPGHEAFTAMRARGAKVTDIAVIVIAADDDVMPQTKEAISHAQAASVPMIFAINKIDKPDSNPERIKEQLAQMNILVEDWGGKYQCQEISAKQGLNVDLLLEKILFEAELLDLKANPNRNAVGTVVEASLDKGRGYVATILVQTGTLNVGDMVLAGQYFGKVRAMFNERGGRVKEAPPSTPVIVLGLNGAPQAGDKIRVLDSEQEVKEIAYKRQQIYREQIQRTNKHITLEEIGRRLALGSFKELNLIVKGDVDGSVEALCDSLQRLSTEEIQVRIIHRGVGAITESDVLLASASDAIIVGFQVRPTANARKQADNENIDIRMYSIIYTAINEIKSAMEGLMEPTVEERFVCNVIVREVFKITKVGVVAGCYVTEGKINRETKIRVIRNSIVVHTGEISSLKRFKDDVKEVIPGMECGISIKNYDKIEVGDIIEGYEEIQVKRTL